MSPRDGTRRSRQHRFIELASRAATLALILFHAWLLWSHLVTGRLADPTVATRWVVGAGLFASLFGLHRLGVPMLFGRKAAVIWTLVVLLHCHAAIAPHGADLPLESTTAILVVPVTLGSAAVGLGLLLWTVVSRRRTAARPQPSPWFVAPMAAAGVATACHVLTLAPRPPPANWTIQQR